MIQPQCHTRREILPWKDLRVALLFFYDFDLISFNSIAKQFDVSLFNVGTNLFSYNNNFFVSYTPDTLYEYMKTNLDQNHNLQLEKINKYDFVLLHLFHTHTFLKPSPILNKVNCPLMILTTPLSIVIDKRATL